MSDSYSEYCYDKRMMEKNDGKEMLENQTQALQSEIETRKHIDEVRKGLYDAIESLIYRAQYHDESKLQEPEKSIFAKYTSKLKDCTYGSDEYKQYLSEMKPALDHHYSQNSHHPEFYPNRIDGMTLLDLVEMLIDWRAASKRHDNGDIMKSIEINTARFNISPQLKQILINTINANN